MQKLLFELDNTLLVINAEVESEIASAEAAFAGLEAPFELPAGRPRRTRIPDLSMDKRLPGRQPERY